MKPLIYFFLVLSLFACSGRKKEEHDTVKCVAIVKKMFIKPFTGFKVDNDKLKLLGPSSGNIPKGFWEVIYSGESTYGDFAIIYQKENGNGKFDFKFGFDDIYYVELNDRKYTIDNDFDSLMTVYDNVMRTVIPEKQVVMFHYSIGLLCFEYLENPIDQSGFSGHLTQQMGNAKQITLQYPYVRLEPTLLLDLRKKKLITENDRVYVNCGEGTAYKYKKIKDLNF